MENPLANLDAVRAIADPAEKAIEIGRRLNLIPAAQTKLKELRRSALQQMQDSGLSLAEIAERISTEDNTMDRSRVWQILQGK